ncbi:hypothetical protein NQ317_015012 [Molorchus minor]|uniref:Galectin n=1 Tax=Molorchus minor TaxID=1323400 RepID=A0ABQ9K4D9_9CUCU|nr:hypothetical protein NQ317_015012 [Molorchus minor]
MEVGVDALDFVVVQTDVSDPPYIDDLPDITEPGSCIRINGFVKPYCRRFAVNLMTSRALNSDIALHINPRISQRYVVRNSRLNCSWEDEETTSINKFEFDRNKKFNLDIVITDKEYLISANGQHVCGYVFRIPTSKVKVLMVEGAVEVYGVEYSKLQMYPAPSPSNAPFSVPTGDGLDHVADQQLDVPVTAVLPRGFQRGWQLEIYGRVKILPHAFYINLQVGTQLWPHPIVPLHLNPRFRALHGKHLLVRNAWIDGAWGSEERTAGVQFSPGAPFSIAIQKNEHHFSVWVDGQLVGELQFRGASEVDTVYIHGDVNVGRIYMKTFFDDDYFRKSQEDLNVHSL